MKKEMFILFILSIVFVASCTPNNTQNTNNTNNQTTNQLQENNQQNTGTNTQSNTGTTTKITLLELMNHDNVKDCWVVYKNKVYDITNILPVHGGGAEAILPYCGTEEFEGAFTKQHETSKVEIFMKFASYKGDYQI